MKRILIFTLTLLCLSCSKKQEYVGCKESSENSFEEYIMWCSEYSGEEKICITMSYTYFDDEIIICPDTHDTISFTKNKLFFGEHKFCMDAYGKEFIPEHLEDKDIYRNNRECPTYSNLDSLDSHIDFEMVTLFITS